MCQETGRSNTKVPHFDYFYRNDLCVQSFPHHGVVSTDCWPTIHVGSANLLVYLPYTVEGLRRVSPVVARFCPTPISTPYLYLPTHPSSRPRSPIYLVEVYIMGRNPPHHTSLGKVGSSVRVSRKEVDAGWLVCHGQLFYLKYHFLGLISRLRIPYQRLFTKSNTRRRTRLSEGPRKNSLRI